MRYASEMRSHSPFFTWEMRWFDETDSKRRAAATALDYLRKLGSFWSGQPSFVSDYPMIYTVHVRKFNDATGEWETYRMFSKHSNGNGASV